MYPLHDNHIRLGELANHWSRDMPQHPAEDEIRTLLVTAYWRGELQIRTADDLNLFKRSELIKIIEDHERPKGDAAKILIGAAEDELPPKLTNDTDGSISIDLRPRLILPENHPRPASVVERAVETMSNVNWEDYPKTLQAGLACCMVSKDDFAEFCDARGYDRPNFWFKRTANSTQISSARARSDARKWLREQTRRPKKGKKDDYFNKAKVKFPGLSRRSFDDLWAELVPPDWGKPGAPKKGPRRND